MGGGGGGGRARAQGLFLCRGGERRVGEELYSGCGGGWWGGGGGGSPSASMSVFCVQCVFVMSRMMFYRSVGRSLLVSTYRESHHAQTTTQYVVCYG